MTIEDGIYEIRYRGLHDLETIGHGLAMLRRGAVLASDQAGGLITGSYELLDSRHGQVRLLLEVPPDGILVTGFSAGPDGAFIDIVGLFAEPASSMCAVFDVAGRPVSVELQYVAPLPN